jgi:hypothetical protein
MGRPKPSMLRHLLRRLESELFATPVATDVIGRCARKLHLGGGRCGPILPPRVWAADAARLVPPPRRYRTETLDSKYPMPTKESLPEDSLYRPFYAKYPQVGEPSWHPQHPALQRRQPAAAPCSRSPQPPRPHPSERLPVLLLAAQAKTEPITLNSTRPSIARQFVQRQLSYLNQGMAATAAFEAAESELRGKLGALG